MNNLILSKSVMFRRIEKIINSIKYCDLIRLRQKNFATLGNDTKWLIALDDSIVLDKLIKKYGVKTILELGTGVGAGTLGLAWSLPSDGFIDTVEQMPRCIEVAKRVIPKYYQKKIRFHYSTTRLVQPFPFINAISYAVLPEGEWDLIVIDGPSFHLEGGEFITSLPRGDIFTLLPKIHLGTRVYIDGSLITVKLLKRFYNHCLKYEDGTFVKIMEAGPQDAKRETLKRWDFIK